MRIAAHRRSFTVLLGLLTGLPALSIDLSAPTLVDLPAALDTTVTIAQLTLTLFMLGFAAGQVLGGYVSDRIGRRPVLIGALVLYSVAGIGCALAMTGPELVWARLLQGVAAGACFVLAFAIVQDLFEGEEARRKRSYVTVILGVVPVLAPALGASLRAEAGWRSVHALLAIGGLVLLAIVWAWVAESAGAARDRLPVGPTAPDVLRLHEDRRFLGLALVNALSYGAIFAYIAGAPSITMHELGLSSGVYALVFASTALAMSAGAYISARLGGLANLLWPFLAIAAAATVAIALASAGRIAPPGLLIPLLLTVCFARGVVAPNLIHLAIGLRQRNAGLASACWGVAQLSGGAVASGAIAGLLPLYGHMGVAATMAMMAGSAAILWVGVVRRTGGVSSSTAS